MNSVSQEQDVRRPVRAPRKQLTVAEYLDRQIDLSGKTQTEIAREAGFNKPNIITMLKKGQTKLPVAKVAAMAKALGIDPIHLFRMVMSEYEPETWTAIEEMILHQPVISDNEFEIIRTIRKSSVANPQLRTNEERARLLAVIDGLHGENAVAD